MEHETDSFKDYMFQGIGALLKFTARAGDSLRVASGNAIEKVDAFQLERRRDRLYARLGKCAYSMLSAGQDILPGDAKISATIEEITAISIELERRFGVSGALEKK